MSFASRTSIGLAVAVLAACGPQTQQSAQVESKPSQSQPGPTPTPAPAQTKQAPATKPASAPTPAVTSPAPPTSQQAAPTGEQPKALVISVGQANVREKPDAKARILHVLARGTRLTVVAKGDQWFHVRLGDGSEGWVAESTVKPAQP